MHRSRDFGLNQVRALLFHPDGKHLFVQYSEQGRMVLLDTDIGSYWEARACLAAGRDLSPDEWRRNAGNVSQETSCAGVPRPPDKWEPRPPRLF